MDVQRVGVLGAGVMGSGIAQVTATAGCTTVCCDVDRDAVAKAESRVTTGRYGFDRAVDRGKLSRADAEAAAARLTFTTAVEDLAATDLVIEAVPERLALKVAVFRQLDEVTPRTTILASNTSGFPIAALAAATNRPAAVVGWHWASPAPVMRFAEIVRTRDTSAETVDAVCALATRCGKHPVVVRDTDTAWGFVANRVYGAMLAEARRVVDEGVATADEVDELMVDCFAWPVGPFAMIRGATSGW
ncbi:MAG TPA: 3-hydroxyacyl-CoA dehydrogenase family protein [Acidimicrobiia bacterium]